MVQKKLIYLSVVILSVAPFVGCDSVSEATASISASAKSLGSKASSLAGGAAGVLNSKGTAKITIDQTYEFDRCFIRFLPIDASRGSILQITNYEKEPDIKSAAFLVQANLSVGEFEKIGNSSFPARFFFRNESSQLWYSHDTQPVTLQIGEVGTFTTSFTISEGSVISVAANTLEIVVASFEGPVL